MSQNPVVSVSVFSFSRCAFLYFYLLCQSQLAFIRGVEGKCVPARLAPALCQGYKQPVIGLPNRVIHTVSAPKHMGPHKDR